MKPELGGTISPNGRSDNDQDKEPLLTVKLTRNEAKRGANSNGKQRGAANANNTSDNFRRVCYFRLEPKTELQLNQVDGQLCTHLILAFAHINSQAQLVVAHENHTHYLEQVREFKQQHPRVRVMISVENEEGHNGFPMLAAANNELRYQFARSAVEFCQRYHLDGLDLHWEFPNFPANFFPALNSRGEQERTGLTKILKALRSAIVENFFDRQLAEQHEITRAVRARAYNTQTEVISRVEPYLLTVAIGGQEAILKSSYELKQVVNLCDWLNVMSYDYFLFKAYSPFTGPVSPLHSIVDPFVPYLSRLSLAWTLQRLLDEGIEREKLIMGIPSHARAYRLIFRNTLPAPFTLAVGTRGGQLDDCLNYREVLEIIKREDTIVEFDEKARVPYLLTDGGYTWISYEDTQSVREKVRHIIDNKLGGYMTWNLNNDDFIGGGSEGGDGVPMVVQNGFTTNVTGIDGTLPNFPLHRAMLDEAMTYVPD